MVTELVNFQGNPVNMHDLLVIQIFLLAIGCLSQVNGSILSSEWGLVVKLSDCRKMSEFQIPFPLVFWNVLDAFDGLL